MEEGADWMANLPEELRSIHLTKLAIPGSHNSGANNLTTDLAPDAPTIAKKLSKTPGFAPLLKKLFQRWCNCQRLSIYDQLMSGIRYLDLRISTSSKDTDFYVVHGLFGSKVNHVFAEITEFLKAHPREVVILDFNHFYQMDKNQHTSLISLINSVFGSTLCEPKKIDMLNLNYLNLNAKQVICIYQHREAANKETLWPRECILAPWPNTKSPRVCVRKLTSYMASASVASTSLMPVFFVCQGILTPDTWHILTHRKDGLHKLNKSLRSSFLSWLHHTPSRWHHQPNIVIHDFVDEDNYIQSVLGLNRHRTTWEKD